MQDLMAFFEATPYIYTLDGKSYHPLQWGAKVKTNPNVTFDTNAADIFIIGCSYTNSADSDRLINADAIRAQLYDMYFWHSDVTVADLGNIKIGEREGDTKAALLAVLDEIYKAGKVAIILGGDHEITMVQYDVYKRNEVIATASMADMLIDLEDSEMMHSGSFLMDMLTNTPNFIAHYNHIGFQSYYTQPMMLETLDKLRFDFYRLGKVKENIEEMEPVLRTSDFFSIDMSVVRYSDAPSNINGSPNGFTGEEICSLARYAGMSEKLTSLGIYGYKHEHDQHNMTAKLISQMIWYFIDGYLVRKSEASMTQKEQFLVFNVVFTDHATVFLKSKRTNRWWMRIPNGKYIPCSYADYLVANSNEIPERWLREQERLM